MFSPRDLGHGKNAQRPSTGARRRPKQQAVAFSECYLSDKVTLYCIFNRPSLKGGLRMSAGQKKPDIVVVVVVVSKFEIRDVWLIQPISRGGQSSK